MPPWWRLLSWGGWARPSSVDVGGASRVSAGSSRVSAGSSCFVVDGSSIGVGGSLRVSASSSRVSGGSSRVSASSSLVSGGSSRVSAGSSCFVVVVVVVACLTCLLTGASASTVDADGCTRAWAEARAALDEYALVMDMAVAEDCARHDRAKPRFDAALAALEEEGCAAATRPALALLPAAVRAVHRAHAHITKDLLAGGRADRVRRATVHDAAGGWMYDLVDRLLDDIRALPPAQHPLYLADDNGGDGMTPIHLAVLFREPWLLERFLALPLPGAVASALAAGAQGAYGMTPLHLATVNADAAMVVQLLEAGAPVDAVDAYGRTALAVAVLAGHDDVATVLADAGWSCPAPGVPTPRQCPHLLRLLLPPPSPTGPATPSPPGPAPPSRPGLAMPSRCPVARVPVTALDAATFERDFVSVRRPVVLEGAMEAWPVLAAWQPHRLRARYADRRVRAGAIPYASVFGERDGHVRLGAFLDYLASVPALPAGTLPLPNTAVADKVAETATPPAPAYLFDSDILDTDRAFFEPDANPLPPTLASLAGAGYPLVRQFFYGPALSGAPYHYHCDAVNALVRGRKRWLLLPPAPSFYSKTHPAHASTWGAFAGTEADRDGAYMCTQEAGELVYVPGFWGHTTLNEAEAIGFAVEFDRGDC